MFSVFMFGVNYFIIPDVIMRMCFSQFFMRISYFFSRVNICNLCPRIEKSPTLRKIGINFCKLERVSNHEEFLVIPQSY